MSLIFICKQSTTLQFIAFEKFLISKIDLLIYALQLIQIVVFGIASINIIVEYFQQIFTLIIAILNIFNQLLSQGFIFKYQRYLLYIINSFLIIYSLFKFIDLMNNVLLILPLLISLIIYADSQQQLNSIYSLFIQNTPTLTLYVYHLLKICNNCHQIEIPYFQTLFIWNQHKFKCKDIGCLCKQSIQFVLDPKQTIIITEPIFKTFIYRKINHIKKIIYSDKQIEKNDVAFYQIVQNTLYIRQGFMMMAIKNFNKILIKFDDQPKDRIIDQPMTQIFSRRRTKSQVDTQIQGIINIQQQKDEKFEKISKNFQISSLELIKVQYRIKQAQIQLNENFSSHVCSPQEYKMSNFIYDYLNNEFDLNEMTSKFINLVKMKIEFYQQLLNSEYLNGNQIFLSMKKFSKNVQYLEKLLLSKYLAYPSAKLRSLILFFYSEIYNNYLKAQNFKKKNNIQQHKFIHRNQSIDFYSDKIGYVLLQLQDDLQNLKIKSFSNNFIKIIGKQNGDDQLHFYQILPEFIKDAHPILVQRFIQSGIARFYRNLSLTFIQQDNGLAKQMEQSFDTIALMNDNKVIFSAIIQDVIDQKAYLLVNVNGLLSGMTFMCLKKLGFTSQEISSVNSFYSFYEIEINQIVPNFRQLIETDFQEQKFDNIKFLFFDITCYSKDIVHKQSLRESKFCKIWQDNQFVKEYLVNLFIMKRNVFGFFYYIIEIESAYQIDCSQQNRNPETIKLSKSNSESGNFDVASLILSLEDNFSERKANLSKQQTIIQTNQVTKHLEFQRNFQPEILSPKGNSKSNLIEKNPQTIYSLQRNYRQYQQDFFCQQPLEYLAEHSSQEMKSQNQNQFDVVYDMNSESSINSIKKPSFIQRLETIERFSSNFNFQQQKILLFFLMLTLSIYFIFSVLILLLLNTDLESKIQDVEMLSFQANIIAPYDRYLGIRAQIYYYQSLYSSQKISIQEQRDLVEPLYSIIGVCYNELKINSFQSLSEKKLKEFFEDLYTNAFFMGTTDNIIYSKNITFREFIHQLLNYQYDYKIIFDKRIPTKGCPCQVFQFSNYFNLQENLEQMSQKILQFSNTKSQQISDKWIKIYIAYLVLCSLLCFLIYWLRSQLNVQIYTIMELVTHIQEQSLQREIENQKALLLNISQKQDLTSLDYPEKQCYDIQEMNVQKENQYYRKQKRKRLNRISNLKSILFSTIFLGFYFFYSSFVIFSSQKFLSQYESTSNFYKLIADLSFRSGNMFLYREMFMLWGNLTYLNKSDGLKLYNLIKIAQNTILEYLEVAPRANQDSLLVSENFINFFQEVQNKDVCSFLDKEYSQVLGQYCLKAFDGSFIKGMLATLTYIRQSIVNQQAMNNFTFRAEDIYYEIEGGQIVSRVFSYMNKQLQKGIITKTENYQFQNQLLSIFFLVALFLILIYFLFFYYNKIKSNLKMMKFSVLLIPSQEIIQNELFEKYIKQIEIKLGYKI
ncbi:unnamed protein product [Paramecium sonneborni]|uniref:Transmembrane protein n=1 Tax=Paramecium sonneborni TaxID=65129 RepID=A0A8S1PDA9_9CILI|nr:unnamed protein product [Paramecium sonneborni]